MDNFRDISFNGRNLQSFGFFLKDDNAFVDFPTRSATTTTIAGSVVGDEISDKGTYGNIERTYTFKSIPQKIPYKSEEKLMKMFIEWVRDHRATYSKLKDTNRKGYFCYAFIKSVGNIIRTAKGYYEGSITFSCRPYWYLESGMNTIKVQATGGIAETVTLINPEANTAYPYIKVSSQSTSGFTLTVNGKMLTISEIPEYIEIDSQEKNVFKGNTPKNNLMTGTTFPSLKSGDNTISILSIADCVVEITPRWRCL